MIFSAYRIVFEGWYECLSFFNGLQDLGYKNIVFFCRNRYYVIRGIIEKIINFWFIILNEDEQLPYHKMIKRQLKRKILHFQ